MLYACVCICCDLYKQKKKKSDSDDSDSDDEGGQQAPRMFLAFKGGWHYTVCKIHVGCVHMYLMTVVDLVKHEL